MPEPPAAGSSAPLGEAPEDAAEPDVLAPPVPAPPAAEPSSVVCKPVSGGFAPFDAPSEIVCGSSDDDEHATVPSTATHTARRQPGVNAARTARAACPRFPRFEGDRCERRWELNDTSPLYSARLGTQRLPDRARKLTTSQEPTKGTAIHCIPRPIRLVAARFKTAVRDVRAWCECRTHCELRVSVTSDFPG